MAIVAVLKNQAARMKDTLVLQPILWLVIASQKVLATKRNHVARVMMLSAKEKKRKDARRKIAVKSKTFCNFRFRLIILCRIQIKGRVYGLFRVLTNEKIGVDKLKYL